MCFYPINSCMHNAGSICYNYKKRKKTLFNQILLYTSQNTQKDAEVQKRILTQKHQYN